MENLLEELEKKAIEVIDSKTPFAASIILRLIREAKDEVKIQQSNIDNPV